MSFGDYALIVIGRTPLWVWAVLALLVVLGVRRLKLRRTHLLTAALAPAAFLIWSLTGVWSAAGDGDPVVVAVIWAASLAVGALTTVVHRGPRPTHLGNGVFQFAGTVTPLAVYLTVFWTRYGLAVWAGFQPELSSPLTLAAVAISAATAGRFIADFAPLTRAARQPGDFVPGPARTT